MDRVLDYMTELDLERLIQFLNITAFQRNRMHQLRIEFNVHIDRRDLASAKSHMARMINLTKSSTPFSVFTSNRPGIGSFNKEDFHKCTRGILSLLGTQNPQHEIDRVIDYMIRSYDTLWTQTRNLRSEPITYPTQSGNLRSESISPTKTGVVNSDSTTKSPSRVFKQVTPTKSVARVVKHSEPSIPQTVVVKEEPTKEKKDSDYPIFVRMVSVDSPDHSSNLRKSKQPAPTTRKTKRVKTNSSTTKKDRDENFYKKYCLQHLVTEKGFDGVSKYGNGFYFTTDLQLCKRHHPLFKYVDPSEYVSKLKGQEAKFAEFFDFSDMTEEEIKKYGIPNKPINGVEYFYSGNVCCAQDFCCSRENVLTNKYKCCKCKGFIHKDCGSNGSDDPNNETCQEDWLCNKCFDRLFEEHDDKKTGIRGYFKN